MSMLKGLTTITLATGGSVLALSLFAETPAVTENANAAPTEPLQKEAVVPTAPSAPAGPFAQAIQGEKSSNEGTATSKFNKPKDAKTAPPPGLFTGQQTVGKPTAPTKPIAAPSVVSMDIAPQVGKNKSTTESQPVVTAPSHVQMHVTPIQLGIDAPAQPVMPQAVTRPEAPKVMEKPVAEMAAPQPQGMKTQAGGTAHNSSMSMPSMNMSMPQMKMPSMNMNMPTTSMGTTVSPQAVSQPEKTAQPAVGH